LALILTLLLQAMEPAFASYRTELGYYCIALRGNFEDTRTPRLCLMARGIAKHGAD